MKRWMKQFFALALLLAFIFLTVPVTQAAGSSDQDGQLGKTASENEVSFPDINCDINLLVDLSEREQIEQVVNSYKFIDSDDAVTKNAYKVYSLKDSRLVKGLKSRKSVSDLISDTYVWIVPANTAEKIRVIKDDGQWRVSGYSTSLGTENKANAVVNAEAIIAAMEILKSSGRLNLNGASAEEVSIQCFDATMYHMTFVLISYGDAEFLIPFDSATHLTGLENGKPYSRQEVIDILESSFGADYEGGSSASLIIFSIVVVLCLLAFGVYKVVKKCKTRDRQ